MPDRIRTIDGIEVPAFFYGTAWKEERTETLTRLAIEAGFRAIDTANQRKHYHEAGVGAGIAAAVADGLVTREDLFIQTKFTYERGQDHRLPYDPDAPLATQVQQSFERSLEHLQLGADGVIDSLVLHGPASGRGWTDDDREVWAAMEALHDAGRVRLLGASNMSADHLETLLDEAQVPPRFLQNRCYARMGWDAEVRAICDDHDVVYQGFSLLTANARELRTPAFADILERTELTPAQAVFMASLQWGMAPLTGTTDPDHMREDLAVFELDPLSDDDLGSMARIAV